MSGDPLSIAFTSAPQPQDVKFLDDKLIQHNLSITSIADYAPMTAVLKDHQDSVLAGIHGWTWGGSAELTQLWVHPNLRRQHLGTRLLDGAEAIVSARGCTQLIFEAFDFGPLLMFYARGYRQVFAFEGYLRGYRKVYLRRPIP